ncbi:MAG: NfeD family protein [Bacilli bacterium]|nr:NfeD family protein [Bacilli bacterium]MDD4283223.1 NfeD family protein [Bacilli bacterium]MDD4719085.1 NfeD family protein [Bacilli bacterium]
MYEFWLLIIVLLTVIEILTVNLTTIWFIGSALITLFLSFFIDNFTVQLSVFVLFGIVFLITTRPILMKYIFKNKVKTNIDRIIGMNGVVIDAISNNEYGSVKVDGKIWRAYSKVKLQEGTHIKIIKINGNKLEVEEE